MKAMYLTAFVLLPLVFGCRKIKEGEVTATKDGKTWVAELYVGKYPDHACSGCMSMVLGTYSPEGFARELIHFGWVPRKEGIYYFSENTLANRPDSLIGTFSEHLGDGSDFSFYYALANDPNSFVEITKITGRRVEGRFQMTAILDSIYNLVDPTLPDTIQFLEGEFESD